VSLQDLVTQTDSLKATFNDKSKVIRKDVDGRIEGFNGFKRPKERIGALEARMKRSRNRTEGLTKRLEMAKTKAQQLESMEDVVQASITFQFRMGWALLVIIIVVVIGLRAYDVSNSTPALTDLDIDDIFNEIMSSNLSDPTSTTSSSMPQLETCANTLPSLTLSYGPDDPLSLFAEL
jgi:hypothetical protein